VPRLPALNGARRARSKRYADLIEVRLMNTIPCASFALLLLAVPLVSAHAASPVPDTAAIGVKPAETAKPLRSHARPLHGSHCLRQTGTRLRLPPGQCAPVFGRVYDRAELEASGSATLAGALTTLDPALGR
jgi:hypothetical protein